MKVITASKRLTIFRLPKLSNSMDKVPQMAVRNLQIIWTTVVVVT